MLYPSCPRAALFVLSQLFALAFATIYPYDYSSLSCPSSALSALLTPTYGDQGKVFTVCSSIEVNAPPSAVRDAVLGFGAYSAWNSFVVSVSLPSGVAATPQGDYVGMPMVFTTTGLVWGFNTTSNEILTVLDYEAVGDDGRPYLMVAWRYDDGLAGVGARAEHPVVIVDLGNGSSSVVSWETYYVGLETGLIALLRSKLQAQFEAQSADLKAYVEGLL
ncbi:hypothetical protein GGS24DRAFT_23412 [Hypoxylon argillaceum]|nr:hypothetical protein GGS24DRAFT_23412 [Hypoxylon argillaceum]